MNQRKGNEQACKKEKKKVEIFEGGVLNACTTKEKRDMTQSASSNHKWTRSYIASFYFKILISESRVSDSSCLGKAGVVCGLV